MDVVSEYPWGYILAVFTTVFGYLLAFILIPRILLDQRGPQATLAWILFIAFIPYLGAAAFYFLGRTRIRRRVRKKRRLVNAFHRSLEQKPETAILVKVHDTPPETPSLLPEVARVARNLTDKPLMTGNLVDVYVDGENAYLNMEEAILSAKHHIHLMSYIYRPDETGRHFRDLLTMKARDGLEVRLLVDGFGGVQVGSSFIRPLIRAGGQFDRFAPILGRRGHWRPNLRNHRKILVADGKVGFTGGLNIGDEYQGRKKKYAPWRDTHLCLGGDAVRQLQEIFAEDWYYATGEDLADPIYFPDTPPRGPDLVQVISSGPDQEYGIIHRVFFSAINEARKRVYITTPYFVPDPPILLALKAAAWRGVDVRILLPGKSDMWLVQLAGRSYYRELLEAGVQLYEHRPGILHAKTMVVDGEWSTVGSANMDIRSFELNFEVNVLVWSEVLAGRMEKIFIRDTAKARPIKLNQLDGKSRTVRFTESLSRVLSPLL